MNFAQIQHAIQAKDPRMGFQADHHNGDHRELAGGAELVDLPGSGFWWRRHSKAAASRSQAFFKHRQSMAKDHAESSRRAQRCALLHFR